MEDKWYKSVKEDYSFGYRNLPTMLQRKKDSTHHVRIGSTSPLWSPCCSLIALCSHSSMFPQLYVPAALCSHSSMFPQLCIPAALCSRSSVFPQLCVPTAMCSRSFAFSQLYVPTALCSCSSMFPQLYVPTELWDR